jgi:hypothetical protein
MSGQLRLGFQTGQIRFLRSAQTGGQLPHRPPQKALTHPRGARHGVAS